MVFSAKGGIGPLQTCREGQCARVEGREFSNEGAGDFLGAGAADREPEGAHHIA